MIRRIRIQNFKSLRDVTVDLEPLTVLVGPSGTGKSNFLGAIRFLRNLLSLTSTIQGFSPDGLAHVLAHRNEATTWDVWFSLPSFAGEFHYHLSLGSNEKLRVIEEAMSVNGRTLFAQRPRHNYEDTSDDWVEAPEVVPLPQTRVPVLTQLPGLEPAVAASVLLTEGIGLHSFDSKTAGESKNTHGIGLRDDAANYVQVLKAMVADVAHRDRRAQMTTALQHLNSTVLSVSLNAIPNASRVVVSHRATERTVNLDLSAESDGFRRFFAQLLALYQTPSKQFLMFEEPENGIHPGALALLAEEFEATAESGRGQVLLTTQSPDLLNHFSDEQIRVVELVELETQIAPLAQAQRECIKDRLLKPGELLTVDLARREVAAT